MLGLPVSNGHLMGAHAVYDLPHYFDGAGRTCHDARAKGRDVETVEVWVVQLGYKHGGNAIKSSAPLPLQHLQRFQGVEVFGGNDDCRAVGDAAKIAHHTAKAVVKGHRDAQPVVLGQLDGVANV